MWDFRAVTEPREILSLAGSQVESRDRKHQEKEKCSQPPASNSPAEISTRLPMRVRWKIRKCGGPGSEQSVDCGRARWQIGFRNPRHRRWPGPACNRGSAEVPKRRSGIRSRMRRQVGEDPSPDRRRDPSSRWACNSRRASRDSLSRGREIEVFALDGAAEPAGDEQGVADARRGPQHQMLAPDAAGGGDGNHRGGAGRDAGGFATGEQAAVDFPGNRRCRGRGLPPNETAVSGGSARVMRK